MFEFIKNLFKKEPLKKEIKLEELSDWFNEETQDKMDVLKAEIKLTFSKIEDERENIKKNLDMLEKADLQNEKISVKERQLMEGNRFAYIKKMNLFMDETSIKDGKRVVEFCASFEESISKLNKSTAKPYYIVREFFSVHALNISNSIKKLDNLVKAVRDLVEKREYKIIEETKNKIMSLKNRVKLEKEIEEQITETESKLNSLEKEREMTKKEMGEIKNSGEFSEFDKLKENYLELIEQINKIKRVFLHDFFVIEPAMKKYSRMSLDEAAVNSYIDNPLMALIKDNEFKIIGILKNLKENILKDELELKDKKREKILAKIDELDQKYLVEFLSNYENLIDERKNLEKLIGSKTVKVILDDANSKLNRLNEEIEKVEDIIDQLNKEKDDLTLEKIKIEIKENLKEITDFEVIIA